MRRLALALAALVTACRRDDAPRPAPEVTAPVAQAPSSLPSAAPSASASPSAPPLARPPIEGRLSLHVVAHLDTMQSQDLPLADKRPRPAKIHRLGGVMLLTWPMSAAVLSADKLKPLSWWDWQGAPGLQEGFVVIDASFERVVGRYPGILWVSVDETMGVDGRLFPRGKGTYVYGMGQRPQKVDVPPAFAEPWRKNGVLRFDGSFVYVGPEKGVAVPERSVGEGGKPRVAVAQMATLPKGDVLVAGEGEGGALAVERWAPGDTKGQVTVLSARARGRTLISASEQLVMVATSDAPGPAASATLHSLEGGAGREIGLPTAGAIVDMALSEGGALWLLVEGGGLTLLRRDTKGAWASAALPAGFTPHGLFGRDERRAYVAGVTATEGQVLSTEDRPLFDEPPPGASASARVEAPPLPDDETAGPLDAACKTPFVILFSVSKTAPANFDYPATRKAMSGYAAASSFVFVEIAYKGSRTLGAKASTAEAAKALVEHIKAQVKGSSPAAVCLSPAKVIRELMM